MYDRILEPTVELSTSRPTSDAVARPRIAMCEGTVSDRTLETQSILRRRLRAALAALSGGFLIFLIENFFNRGPSIIFFTFIGELQMLVTALLAGMFALLSSRLAVCLKHLRLIELVTFAVPGLFFLVLQWDAVASREVDYVQISGPAGVIFMILTCLVFWVWLAFAYAMFIPNSLRRAAVVIGVLTMTPLAFTLFQYASSDLVRQCLDPQGLVVIGLTLLITWLCATYGTRVIGTLREEVYAARQLGQYRLKSLIGAGGMGEVYLAEHVLLKRPCAIKLIQPSRAADPRALARFEREVHATAKLSHWNTVEIYDYGRTDDGTFYYVMEYLPGLSLGDMVDRFGPLAPERVVYLLRQACAGLAEAHQAGLIHRDIKPGNIIAAHRGGQYDVVKIVDFGLVKLRAVMPQSHLTQEGTFTGSPLYMSPEQALGDDVADNRGDIYSLGGVAYFLLTGVPPFSGDRAMEVVVAHARDPVRPPHELRPEVPADLEQVILKMLAKLPEDRFQTVGELDEALADCESADGWGPREAAEWWQQADLVRV